MKYLQLKNLFRKLWKKKNFFGKIMQWMVVSIYYEDPINYVIIFEQGWWTAMVKGENCVNRFIFFLLFSLIVWIQFLCRFWWNWLWLWFGIAIDWKLRNIMKHFCGSKLLFAKKNLRKTYITIMRIFRGKTAG